MRMTPDFTDALSVGGKTYKLKLAMAPGHMAFTAETIGKWDKSNTGDMLVWLVESDIKDGTYLGLIFAAPHADYAKAFDGEQHSPEAAMASIKAFQAALMDNIGITRNCIDPVDHPPESGTVVGVALFNTHDLADATLNLALIRLSRLPWMEMGYHALCVVEITSTADG